MQQKHFNAEFVSIEYLNAGSKNMHVIRIMNTLTKVLHNCF